MARRQRKQRASKPDCDVPKRGGGDSLLVNPKEIAKDTALIRHAVVKKWPVSQTIAEKIVGRLEEIIDKKTVTVPAGDGVFPSESKADENAIKASALLERMVSANNRAPGKGTTVNVGVNVATTADERRNRTLAIAERFGTQRVLSDSRSEDGRSHSGAIEATVRKVQ